MFSPTTAGDRKNGEKIMTMKEALNKGKANAPCYYHLYNDGATAHCNECGADVQMSNFVMTFTPNGEYMSVHLPCVDEWWLAHATDLGRFPA